MVGKKPPPVWLMPWGWNCTFTCVLWPGGIEVTAVGGMIWYSPQVCPGEFYGNCIFINLFQEAETQCIAELMHATNNPFRDLVQHLPMSLSIRRRFVSHFCC